MPEPQPDSTDQQLDQELGNLLRGGVMVAAAVVLLGGIVYLATRGGDPADHRTFHGEPEELCHPVGVVRAVLALDIRGVIQLGLLLLIATPVARVFFTVFAFARQRDWTYVAITLLVLGLLLYSLFWGS
jgi:uncharacterized membrane protein